MRKKFVVIIIFPLFFILFFLVTPLIGIFRDWYLDLLLKALPNEKIILDESIFYQIWTSTINTFIVSVLSFLMYDFNVRSQKKKNLHKKYMLYLEIIDNIERILKYKQTYIDEELNYLNNNEYSYIILLGKSLNILEEQNTFINLINQLHKIERYQGKNNGVFDRSVDVFVKQYFENEQLKPKYESLIKKAFGISERE